MAIQIVSFHCVLKNQLGQVIGSTFNQEVLTHSSDPNDMLKGLAEGLKDLSKGEKRRIFLKAEEAYGFYNPEIVINRLREDIPNGDRLRVCDQVAIVGPDNKRQMYRVIEASRDYVVLDANHPLAGQDLIFEIEATEAREATAEEISDSLPVSMATELH